MPANIEIKARLADPAGTLAVATAISDTPPRTLRQRDTFFRCAHGRLKLRETATGPAELIFYVRPDGAAARRSDYEITPVADPGTLRAVLSRSLGVTQTVAKTRVLCLVGQTRVHLDSVDGLGDFLELEVVLEPGQDPADARAVAADLMQRLGIREADLCATAYADMITASHGDAPAGHGRAAARRPADACPSVVGRPILHATATCVAPARRSNANGRLHGIDSRSVGRESPRPDARWISLMGVVYDEFQRDLGRLRASCSDDPHGELIRLFLIALEREEIVSVGYRESLMERRLAALPSTTTCARSSATP